MRVRGLAACAALALLSLTACMPVKVNGGGSLPSTSGNSADKAQIQINADTCIKGNGSKFKVTGKFSVNDRNAAGWAGVGGVKFTSDRLVAFECLSTCNEPPELCDRCPLGTSQITYTYTSSNKNAPGTGSGYSCVWSFLNGNNQIDGAIIHVDDGPYGGYETSGGLQGNFNVSPCSNLTVLVP